MDGVLTSSQTRTRYQKNVTELLFPSSLANTRISDPLFMQLYDTLSGLPPLYTTIGLTVPAKLPIGTDTVSVLPDERSMTTEPHETIGWDSESLIAVVGGGHSARRASREAKNGIVVRIAKLEECTFVGHNKIDVTASA